MGARARELNFCLLLAILIGYNGMCPMMLFSCFATRDKLVMNVGVLRSFLTSFASLSPLKAWTCSSVI